MGALKAMARELAQVFSGSPPAPDDAFCPIVPVASLSERHDGQHIFIVEHIPPGESRGSGEEDQRAIVKITFKRPTGPIPDSHRAANPHAQGMTEVPTGMLVMDASMAYLMAMDIIAGIRMTPANGGYAMGEDNGEGIVSFEKTD